MTDIVDHAAELEEAQREDALRRQRERSAVDQVSALECDDCGEPIAQARREAVPGCGRCIDCERIAEARRRIINLK